ncbi:MAG: DUF2357 domain-containing protein [Firmicutes bacterium]|nr:DUF2357 domain-containing protein [Bacillota bacterium]
MDTLFRIETDKVILSWSIVKKREVAPLNSQTPTPGRLHIIGRRYNLSFERIYRCDPPGTINSGIEVEAGPHLFEQTDYKVYARAKKGNKLRILHRDPVMTNNLNIEDDGKTLYGVINFGSQIGLTEFSLILDGEPEFDFLVEVFPSKLDYTTDYEKLLAEVQENLTGLALEYLRSTFQLGQEVKTPKPTHVEWLLLLRHVVDDLEQALQHIGQQPIRGLTRDPVNVRADRIKKIDSTVRAAARRGNGSGSFIPLRDNIWVKEKVMSQQARQTLDTPEHRWIAQQLLRLRQRISLVRREEAMNQRTERRNRVLSELDKLESRINRLSKQRPFDEVSSRLPTPNFSSLQLLGAPGYREAYRCCIILSMGLRIEGGPIKLSVKDLSLLYEYWCFLALLRLISKELNSNIPVKELFDIQQKGLRVLIEKGRQKSIEFSTADQRKITVSYNPRFQGESILIPQQPDLVITLDDPKWQRLHLVLDAKYRIDASPKYIDRYKSPGPPEDAVNIMHRYRDAILESEASYSKLDDRPKRTVVQAAAVFPYREQETDQFKSSLLWKSLDKIGVGALPALPDNTEYLREWLNLFLRQGGWALADRAIDHRGRAKIRDWRIAASEAVLIGVLRSSNVTQHLEWVLGNNLYYMSLLKTQKRQFAAKWLALYIPKFNGHGSVAYWAPIMGVEIVKRKEVPTPWGSGKDKDRLQVLYKLGQVTQLPKAIVNRDYDGKAQRFSSHRWTSRLALERAEILPELLIETEPEWRLYEDLMAMNQEFKLVPEKAMIQDPDVPSGRVWFVLEDGLKIRYAGASGYVLKHNTEEKYFMKLEEVLEYVKRVGAIANEH